MTSFVDRVVLHVRAGNGGHGCASILREKFKPLGGPDGGDGGHGGSIILTVDSGVHTLLDFHFRAHVKAENGKGGSGNNRDGADGRDLTLRVPDGTVVQTVDGEPLADLVGVPFAIAAIAALTFSSGVVVLVRMYETLPAKRTPAAEPAFSTVHSVQART